MRITLERFAVSIHDAVDTLMDESYLTEDDCESAAYLDSAEWLEEVLARVDHGIDDLDWGVEELNGHALLDRQRLGS